MANYAIISAATGLVENLILWDGADDWVPPDGFVCVPAGLAGIGWSYVAGQFSAPPVPPVSDADLRAKAMSKRDELLSIADKATAGMADAYVAGLLNEGDEVTFKAYAAYKLALNKVDAQPGYPSDIEWPTSP